MTLRNRLKGSRATVTHRKNALALQLAYYLRTSARLDKVLKVVRKVARGQTPVETLNSLSFLSEPVRVVRIKGIPKGVWKQASQIFTTDGF